MIFTDRMVDIEIARIEERPEIPQFPPDGYEIRLYPPKERRPYPPSQPDETDAPAPERVPDERVGL